jgi:FkbM family methyltransferase
LAPIAAAVDAIGFEPDQAECERLNATPDAARAVGLRSLRYVPSAVGEAGERTLNLYRARGCTSLLEGDAEFAAQFGRGDYFILDGQVNVNVERLDDAARRFAFTDAQFMKIDIQGAEREAIRSAPDLVDHALLAIRSEVEFAPLYKDQPLFADLDAELRAKGFTLARFLSQHKWRRGDRTRGDRVAPGPVPLAEGQLIHGDVLYFRRPETMNAARAEDQDRLINLALLAFAYGHVDLSAAVLSRGEIATRLRERVSVNASALIAELGRAYAARRRMALRRQATTNLRHLVT